MQETKRVTWFVRHTMTSAITTNQIGFVFTDEKIFFGANSNFDLIGAEINVDATTTAQPELISYSLLNLDANGNTVVPSGAAYFDNGTGLSQQGDIDIATFAKGYTKLAGPLYIAQGLQLTNLKIKATNTMAIGTQLRITIGLILRAKQS